MKARRGRQKSNQRRGLARCRFRAGRGLRARFGPRRAAKYYGLQGVDAPEPKVAAFEHVIAEQSVASALLGGGLAPEEIRARVESI